MVSYASVNKARPIFPKIGRDIKNQAVNLQTNQIRMPERSCCFLVVVLMLIFGGKIYAQSGNADSSFLSTSKSRGTRMDSLKIIPLQPGFYIQNLSFFCRQEIKLQKITLVPIRFRLGSLEYTNYLEGKPNSRNAKF